LKIHTKAVHAGERKAPARQIPVSTPIHTGSSFVAENMESLDRIFGEEEKGFAYSRYASPTNDALEEQITALENGRGALACASGMTAIHMAVTVALLDRRKSVLASQALYGATTKFLLEILEPFGVAVRFVDTSDFPAFESALVESRPGCVLIETISNPLLRVAPLDRIAARARQVGAAVVVDNTFATPLLLRPLELGANLVVHSATKYLAGHGDVLGGVIVADADSYEPLRKMSRITGPVLGPFESYLTLRGIKTFPLRMERQCQNACQLASWLTRHPRVERVYYPADPRHPDAESIARLLPDGLYGGIVSFELKDARQEDVFRFMDRLQLIVKATSLGDVHTMMLYPWMSSHRDISPKQRERTGIRESLIRVSAGIEAIDDIIADVSQALG
jgi:cystathionine beta-lyase/cystathionine gamma-synthase